MPNKKIVIAAGGTGGPLYPGIALAKELKKEGYEPVFFVRQNDIGKEILDKEGFRYNEISAMGFPRGLSFKLFAFPFVMLKGFGSAFRLLKTIHPLAVAGMGSYVSFPAVICAKILKIPCIIHEQNAFPGITNRILSRFADKIALSFTSSIKYFPGNNTVVTGNPVRPDLFNAAVQEAYARLGLSQDKFTVFVFGGSQGALKINDLVIDSFEYLSNIKDKLQFLHVSGPKYYDAVLGEYNKRNIPGRVIAYAHGIGDAYTVADLIICRSGATTVAELKILNKRAVLIPFPHATANHQEHNARALEKEGMAQVIIEKDLTPQMLAGVITEAFNSQSSNNGLKIPPVFPQELLAAEIAKLIHA